MQYKLHSSATLTEGVDLTVIGVFQDENISQVLQSVSKETNLLDEEFIGKIVQSLSDDKFVGKANQQVVLPTYSSKPSKKIMLYGLGSGGSWNAAGSRKMAANVAKTLRPKKASKIIFVLREPVKTDGTTSGGEDKAGDKKDDAKKNDGKKDGGVAGAKPVVFVRLSEAPAREHARAVSEGWLLGNFSFSKHTASDAEEKQEVEAEFEFAGLDLSDEQLKADCQLGENIAAATNMARQMINEPPAHMTPTIMAEHAKSIADKQGLHCQIMEPHEVEALKMGSFLGVAKGATEPLRFIILKYTAPDAKKTVAIIGKGITFDSGGLSLKPANSMEHMKYDMAGGAAVLAAMQVVGMHKPPISVLALVPATENMPGSNALHPGDILTAMNGKTIEVNNTDAEGRLVLADALCYAVQQNVDEIIDLATLTGAIVTALGRAAAGIMGNNQALIDNVIKSGAKAGEKMWQLPMYEEYKEALKSDVADLKNAGARGEAGSSAAAMFLQEFCGAKPWAHLDICGPGWMEKPKDEMNKGATAYGVRSLCYYLLGL